MYVHNADKPASRIGGFTLVELIIASAVMGFIIAGTLSVFLFGLRTWHEESIKNELNLNLEIALERFRMDLRLSSMSVGGSMAFYPPGSNLYTAISMPIALDDDGDNLLERDEDEKIIWDETVIYHVRQGAPDELVRTIFAPKNTNATPAEIYTQLTNVVAGATTAAALSNEVYSSKVIFRNLVQLNIKPISTYFDGYTPSIGRESSFNFGSIIIGSGNHDLRLEVVGKNQNSAGYKLGIDKFSMSPSDSVREGEYYLTTNNYGHFTYSKSPGTSVSTSNMSGIAGNTWSGNEQFTFTPSSNAVASTGDVWLALNVYNDLWLDTRFNVLGGTWQKNASVKSNDFVSMDKGYTWDVLTVSGAESNDTDATGYTGNTIAVIVAGEYIGDDPGYDNIQLNGRFMRVEFTGPGASGSNSLEISNVRSGVYTGGLSLTFMTNLTFSGSNAVEIAAGNNVWSDWVDVEIEKEKSYFVEFTVSTNADKDAISYWTGSFVTNSIINGAAFSTNIFGVSRIEVRYPDEGFFRSGIFDTQMSDPQYDRLKWQHLERNTAGQDYHVSGGALAGDVDVKVRSGDSESLTGGVWKQGAGQTETNYFNGGAGPDVDISSLPEGRYFQYETMFTCETGTTNEQTGDILDLMIDWPGSTGIVDLNMSLTTGPDYGIYSATIDGQILARALEVDLTIFKRFPFVDRTHTVRGKIQVNPLNTGK